MNESKAEMLVPAPRKLGGWLVLVAVGVMLNPLFFLIRALSVFDLLNRIHFQGYKVYMGYFVSTLNSILTFNIIINCLFFLFSFVLAFHFFKKTRKFPHIFIFFLGFATFLGISEFLWAIMKYRYDFGSFPDPLVVVFFLRNTSIIGFLLQCAIWIPYFKLTPRVRETFIC